MSKYTTMVRFVAEQAVLDHGMNADKMETMEIINKSLPYVFDFNFPIYDEAYRNVLEKKIVTHFYFREIGMETVGLWKFYLNMKMNEIMPYYNELYKSTLIEFNPLYDVDVETTRLIKNQGDKTETGNENSSETSSGTGNETGSQDRSDSVNNKTVSGTTGTSNDNTVTTDHATLWDYYQDTPQGGLEGVKSLEYLTNVTSGDELHNITANVDRSYKDDNTTTTTGTNTGTTTDTKESKTTGSRSGEKSNNVETNFNDQQEYIEHVVGYRNGMTLTAKIREFRDALLNIDMMIIEELEELFMGLW